LKRWRREGKKMIIGFTGAIGAGKTTAALRLVESHGFTRVRFAGPLKAMLRGFGLTDEQIDGNEKEKPCAVLGGCTPRYAMQTLGTEWGRELIHPDLWVNAWAREAVKYSHIVVDDVRHQNEIDAIKQVGGIILRVFRPGAASRAGEHSSETESLPFDYSVSNHGSVNDLETRILDLISRASTKQRIHEVAP
jgi:hypothetical protein